jgi:hypothetical protein
MSKQRDPAEARLEVRSHDRDLPCIDGGPMWTIEDVAALLRKPKGTLYQWRYIGYGPRAFRIGRVALRPE